MSSSSSAADRLRQMVALLQQEIYPQRLLPTLISGFVTSMSTVIYAISFVATDFQESAQP